MFHVKLSKKDKPFMGAYLFYLVLFCLKQGLWNENGMKAVSNNYFLLIMSNFVSGMLRRAVSASLNEISFSGL